MWPTWKENKLFTVLLTFFMIVTICFVVQKTESLKRPVPQEHQISVEGVGKAVGKPDIATISFGVVSKAADVEYVQTLMAEGKITGVPSVGKDFKETLLELDNHYFEKKAFWTMEEKTNAMINQGDISP